MGGGGTRVSDFSTMNSHLRQKNIFFLGGGWGGGGMGGQGEGLYCIFFTKNPNLKKKKNGF